MALGPEDRKYEEEEPWDIGESHHRLAASPGGYEEEEVHGRSTEDEDREKRRRPDEDRPYREDYPE